MILPLPRPKHTAILLPISLSNPKSSTVLTSSFLLLVALFMGSHTPYNAGMATENATHVMNPIRVINQVQQQVACSTLRQLVRPINTKAIVAAIPNSPMAQAKKKVSMQKTSTPAVDLSTKSKYFMVSSSTSFTYFVNILVYFLPQAAALCTKNLDNLSPLVVWLRIPDTILTPSVILQSPPMIDMVWVGLPKTLLKDDGIVIGANVLGVGEVYTRLKEVLAFFRSPRYSRSSCTSRFIPVTFARLIGTSFEKLSTMDVTFLRLSSRNFSMVLMPVKKAVWSSLTPPFKARSARSAALHSIVDTVVRRQAEQTIPNVAVIRAIVKRTIRMMTGTSCWQRVHSGDSLRQHCGGHFLGFRQQAARQQESRIVSNRPRTKGRMYIIKPGVIYDFTLAMSLSASALNRYLDYSQLLHIEGQILSQHFEPACCGLALLWSHEVLIFRVTVVSGSVEPVVLTDHEFGFVEDLSVLCLGVEGVIFVGHSRLHQRQHQNPCNQKHSDAVAGHNSDPLIFLFSGFWIYPNYPLQLTQGQSRMSLILLQMKGQLSPAHNTQQVSPKVSKMLHGLQEPTRRKLQQTVLSELDRIKDSVERQLERERIQREIGQTLLRRRAQSMKRLQAKTEKTANRRSENIKVRKETLKRVHQHVNEVGKLKEQADKAKTKQLRKLSEAARDDTLQRLKQRENETMNSFMMSQKLKILYSDSISKKNTIYMSGMMFADRSKDEVYQRLLKAQKNQKHILAQKLSAFVPQRQRQRQTYETAEQILNNRRNQNIHELVFKIKRSEYQQGKNDKAYDDKMKTKRYNIKEMEIKLKENKNTLRKTWTDRIKSCICRTRSPTKTQQSISDGSPELRDQFESPKPQTAKSAMRETAASNFFGIVEKHKAQIRYNTKKKHDRIVNRQNDISKMLRTKSKILQRASSVQLSARFNRDRINPEQITIF